MKMGVVGAAIASGLGQVFSVAVLLSHFVRKRGSLRFRRFPVSGALIGKICKRSVPEAASQLTTPVTALCYNLMLARLVGDIGVSTFSVLSFIYSLVNAILSGTAQGLQPLWGLCYGEQDADGMNLYFRWGIRINAILSVVIYVLLFLFAEPVIQIFNRDPELVQNASAALSLFGLSFIPMALNLIYTAFLYSTKRTLQADAISLSRGVVLKAAAIFCMPVLFGIDVIWLAPFAAELLTLVLALVLSRDPKLAECRD